MNGNEPTEAQQPPVAAVTVRETFSYSMNAHVVEEHEAQTDEWKMPKSREELFAIIAPLLTPMGIFMAVLLVAIVVSGAILFMVLVGWIPLSGVYPNTSANWIEINSQILDTIFTLTALMTQPIRAMLLIWTVKWANCGEEDTAKKREYARLIREVIPDVVLYAPDLLMKDLKVGSRGGEGGDAAASALALEQGVGGGGDGIASSSSQSNHHNHTQVSNHTTNNNNIGESSSNPYIPTPTMTWYYILACLNGQCIFQYPITFAMLYWAGRSDQRPAWIVGTFLPLSFLSGMAGGIWPMLLTRARKNWDRERKISLSKTQPSNETVSSGQQQS